MKRVILILFLVDLALVTGCSKKESESDFPGDINTEIEWVTSTQTDLFQNYVSLLDYIDTSSALDSMVVLFENMAEVEWAEKSITGVSVQYKSGIKGGIFIGSRRDHDGDDFTFDLPAAKANGLYKSSKGVNSNDYCIPPTLRTTVIAPAYTEFWLAVDTLLELHDEGFNRVEFWRPEVELDSDASVEKFAFFANYGVILLYSHGAPWPSQNNIQEVYLQTGEIVNSATNSRYWRLINQGEIPLLHGYEGNLYFIGPEFIKEYNNLENDSTLIFGGFCFSGLGSWPQAMLEIGAKGYWGFDWSVTSNKCDMYEYMLIETMTNTTFAKPFTCQSYVDFLNRIGGSSYYDRKYKRDVGIHYYGEPNLALWEPDEPNLDFPHTNCTFHFTSKANFSMTAIEDYNFIFSREVDVEGSYNNGFFSGTYEYIDGNKEWHDTLIVEIDLESKQIRSFEAWGRVEEPGDISNYLISSSDKPLQLDHLGEGINKGIDSAEVEDYIYQVSYEHIFIDEEMDNLQRTNRLNYVIYDDLSEVSFRFSY